jgi:hypothetical protein
VAACDPPARLPVNFVTNNSEEELARFRQIADVDACMRGDAEFRVMINEDVLASWCLLSYFYLRDDHRIDVRVSNRIDVGAINIVHTVQLESIGRPPNAFVVAVRADFRRRPWAHYHIVQNRAQLKGDTSCIYVWPQPGLLPRNAARKGVKTLGYIGQTYDPQRWRVGNLAWSVDEWKALFAGDNLEFRVPDISNWHDLRELDVLIAIRSFDGAPYNGKPPSKLVNAWLAGIPFIGGADSAYTQIGINGVNYIQAHTPDAVVAAVRRLRDDPKLFRSLVENGTRAVRDYTVEATRERWIQAIDGPIRERYRRWLEHPSWEWIRTVAIAEADVHYTKIRRYARMALAKIRKR